MAKNHKFTIPEDRTIKQLLEEIGGAFMIIKDRSDHSPVTYYDTSNLLLHCSGFALIKNDHGWRIRKLSSGHELNGCDSFRSAESIYANSFPDEFFCRWLNKKVNVRTLSPIARMEVSCDWFHCLNEDEKTVIRFKIEARSQLESLQNQPSERILEIHRLRGYGKDTVRLMKIVRGAGCRDLVEDGFHRAAFALLRAG